MRYRILGGILMGAWLGAWPLAAHADYLSSARDSLKKGDLKSAQIDLRNAVRSDPQNAEAHYWLGKVAIELGDPVAAEREALAARDRGFDPHQSVPLLAQAMLAQSKFDDLLQTLRPDGKDATLDAAILVARGYAQIGLRKPDEAAKSFADAEQVAPNAVEPLLADARLAVARADLNNAQQKIDRAIQAQPKSPEALLAKSQLLRMKNDGVGAMTVLDQLIRDQPSITQARLDRASLALALGKNDLAKSDIDTVLKATPGNVQGIYLQAVMEAQARDYRAADKDLERIAAYIGRIQRAYYLQAVVKEQLGQFEQAEDAAKKYLARAPNDLAAYKILARIQFAQRRPDQVVDTLSKVAESGKADAETYDLIGRAYAATNQSDPAVAAFQKAESLAPDDVGLQTRLASVRMGMGQVDAAMGDLEHTLEMAPKLPAVGEALFFAALATGDLNKAADALAKIKAAQGDTEVTGNLVGLYKLAQIDLQGARDTFTALTQKYPDFAPARINLARVMAMMGDRESAEKMLADLLAKQPAVEPALSMLASSYTQNGRVPEAITLVEAARAAQPANLRVLASLGDLYIRNGNAQKALDLVGQQKGSIASSTEILSLQAAAQLALGQKKEARDTYTEILKSDPSVVGARRQLEALLLEIGDFETARNVVKAGITVAPRNYQLYQDLAIIDLKSTGVDAALATADRLSGQDREFIAIRGLKGDVYMAANRPEDAVNAYTEALAGAPDGGIVSRLASAQLRSRKPEDAIKTLNDWLSKHSDDMTATEQLSEIDISLNRYDDAAAALEKVLQQKPHDAVALNNLAWVYQQKNDPRAQGLARQAYVLAPGPQTADTLGWIMTTGGNAQTGVALLRQANAEASTDPRVQYHYAVALKQTGQKDEAVKMLNAVVAVKGDFQEKADAQKLLDELAKGT
ncbi:MAG: PEP-CTERM system TPR-repeat protein PrsT [Acetobacteraceae bacterium]|nr:PEP-CTERM system TPR-repeat protein PrsT [Acetobacteraceae bacterium]